MLQTSLALKRLALLLQRLNDVFKLPELKLCWVELILYFARLASGKDCGSCLDKTCSCKEAARNPQCACGGGRHGFPFLPSLGSEASFLGMDDCFDFVFRKQSETESEFEFFFLEY